MIEDIERLNEAVKRISATCTNLKAAVERLDAALAASRKNEQTAREERDAALIKISKTAARCERATGLCEIDAPRIVGDIQAILGVCPLCGILGRISDTPCTHLGSRTASS